MSHARLCLSAVTFIFCVSLSGTASADSKILFSGEKPLNGLVTELLDVENIAEPKSTFSVERQRAGYLFFAVETRGKGMVSLQLDAHPAPFAEFQCDGNARQEAFQLVAAGSHKLTINLPDNCRVEKLVVRAVPELIHCGLGFDPAIKSYGKYDLDFLKKDILPNVTTLVVPPHLSLEPSIVESWHRQGKKFIGAVGVAHNAKSVEEHFRHWTGTFERSPFLDGIIIDEFIVNNPIREWLPVVTSERQKRFDDEKAQYPLYEETFRQIRRDARFREKMIYAYVGGSGKKLNQEIIGPNFIHTLLDCQYQIALERYIFEVSSEQKSKEVLDLFVDGIADWVSKEPTVRSQMILTFGLFSMPPGGINKQPNVDYHVWMDQQMNVVANHPTLAGIAGINWWTSLQADEETVRFVGKLYRHYGIEGRKDLLTKDPLFLSHLKNTDFEHGIDDWTLSAAEESSLQPKSFPRYGRIEGRYMGLGKPADPEHIGDTFLWMKRSAKAPNTFSQTIKNLEPGRLYSLKMFSCDYQDLIEPKQKTKEQAQPFLGRIVLDGVEVDSKRSFQEAYSSSPEPPIPVWITYHWIVFRAQSKTAKMTVSDWNPDQADVKSFGQEQTFNFLELQPYHE